MLAAAVRRLSSSAACDGVLLISDQKCVQSTLTAMATNGSTTNAAPSTAGMYTQRGSGGCVRCAPLRLTRHTLGRIRHAVS